MTALAASRVSAQFGTPQDGAGGPIFRKLPVAAGVKIYAGGMVSLNAAGYACATGSTSKPQLERVIGMADTDIDNTIAGNTNGGQFVLVWLGCQYFNISTTPADIITEQNVGLLAYASDDNTLCLTDGGGTRPPVGRIEDVSTPPNTSTALCAVWFAQDSLIQLPTGQQTPAFKVRAVGLVGDLAAYTGTGTGTLTGSANGTIHTVDGLTLAVGDVVMFVTGTTNLTAADAGPWTVSNIGGASAKFVLTRPSWWEHGATILEGSSIEVGGEGATFGLTGWKSNVQTNTGTIDTTDPAFYPGRVTLSLTLVAGTVTTALIPIRSATKSGIEITRTTANTTASTIQYAPSTITAGALGTASLVIQAQVAAGTINNADISTLCVTVINF